jgi:phospholipid transport system substrate-binding protein
MTMSGYSRVTEVFVHAVSRGHIPVRGIIPRFGRASVAVMMQFFLTVSFVLIAYASLAAPPPVNPADAVAFMSRLWANARDVLSQKADPALRRTRFAQLFHEDFDGPGMARFVVGRYWRTASQEEQQEFVGLFEDYVVFVYTARLGDFGGERFNIRSSRSDGDGVIVSTAIFGLDNTSPLNVDWRLVSDNGAYKINDVIVEGISMGVTQRSEFASVVQRNGGQLRGLIALMKEKTANAAN